MLLTRRAALRNLWAVAAWGFVAVAVAVVVTGMSHLYAHPDALRIEAFSDLYDRLGLSDSLMITVLLVLPFGFAIVAASVTLWRRSGDGAAVFLAVGLVAVYLFVSGAILGIGTIWVRNLVGSVAIVMITWFLSGFPTASIIPRWGRLAPLAAMGVTIADPSFAVGLRQRLTDPTQSDPGDAAVLLAIFAVTLAAQVVRYRRHSTRTQQYQTRWVLVGLVLMMVPPGIVIGLSTSGAAFRFTGWLVMASALGSFVLPVAVVVAVFRYHLYDLDRFISRTVTYGLVAFVVGVAYALPVLVLPTILGQGSSVVVAGATLAAAAVFGPARRRIQTAADRRFNRTRYDATREVEALSERLAGESMAGDIEAELLGVIGRTLEPASAGLWLRG